MSNGSAHSANLFGKRHAVVRLKTCLRRMRSFLTDRSAAGAIEFALIAPILIAIYLSTFEITHGYTVAGKVLKAAGTVADLVTRQSSVDNAFLGQMMDAAEATVAPNFSTDMTMKITGITIDSAGNAKVLWSWDQDGGAPYSSGTSFTVPEDMRTPSSFLVHAEVTLPYKILLFLGSVDRFDTSTMQIPITRGFYYRQRLSEDIPCTDCAS